MQICSRICVLILSVLQLSAVAVHAQGILNVCARSRPELQYCRSLVSISPLNRQCPGPICISYRCILREDCGPGLQKGYVVLAPMDPVSIFAYHNTVPPGSNQDLKIVVTETHGQLTSQSCGVDCPNNLFAVAVVKKETCYAHPNLTLAATKGWTSCHGEYGSLSGWVVPLYQLQSQNLVSGRSDVEQMSSFYPRMCAPSGIAGVGVCSGCNVQNGCTTDDIYYGPDGVLQCLTDGDNTTIGFLDNFSLLSGGRGSLVGNQNAEAFRILTRDGCQEIAQFALAGYALGPPIPPHALVTTFNQPPSLIEGVRADFTAAAATTAFQWLFSLENNTAEYMFSQGTDGLANSTLDVTGYLGWLLPVLTNYVKIAVDPTAQGYITDTGTTTNVTTTTTKTSPGLIAGVFFGGLGAGLLCCGLAVLLVVFVKRRRENKPASKAAPSAVVFFEQPAPLEVRTMEAQRSTSRGLGGNNSSRSSRYVPDGRIISSEVPDEGLTTVDLAAS